jgi:type VI secretion system protein VasG
MRAITQDIKTLAGRLGPVAVKALDLAIGGAMRAGNSEVTPDHLLRAALDLADCDVSVALHAAGIARVDVAARLDWHLRQLPTGHKGKPTLAPRLVLLMQDGAELTTDRVRTGHLLAAVLADPKLSGADLASTLAALPREPLHLLASRLEDRGEVGKVAAEGKPVEAAKAPAQATPAATKPAPAPPAGPAPATPAAPPRTEPKSALGKALSAHFGDRVIAASDDGLSLSARVGGRDTSLRMVWDTEARVLVLRIALPGGAPADEGRAALALSTLNNSLPHGAFVLDDEGLAFRSHVFMDAAGSVPVETVAFAARMCEQAAEALGA